MPSKGAFCFCGKLCIISFTYLIEMQYISKSAATSSLVFTTIRDHPDVDLYQYYCFVMTDAKSNTEYMLFVQDQSVSTANYQHFIVTGSTIDLTLDMYNYKLYAATGMTNNDILYNNILEPGIIKLIG